MAEKISRLLAAIASQPAGTRRVTGACAARRAATGEGFHAAALWGFPESLSNGEGFRTLAQHVCMSLALPWSEPASVCWWQRHSPAVPGHAGTPPCRAGRAHEGERRGVRGARRAAEGCGVPRTCLARRVKARVPRRGCGQSWPEQGPRTPARSGCSCLGR